MPDTTLYRLGENNELLTLNDVDAHRAASLAMAHQAQRSLYIFSQDLDHALFDNADFEEAASRLARRSQYSFIRILLQDPTAAVRRGHRLVNLAQRLSSHVEIRKPTAEYAGEKQAFLVADETAYLSRQIAETYIGVANFNDRPAARNLVQSFETIWQRSQPIPELRRLHL